MGENKYSQLETNKEDSVLITGNLSPKQTEERVLRRLIIEILPSMISSGFAEKQGVLAEKAIRETAKSNSNYENAPEEAWRETLENFVEKSLELIILKKPLEYKDLLLSSDKNPIIKRIVELKTIAEDIMFVGWHQAHGIIIYNIENRPKYFPEIKSKIKQKLTEPNQNNTEITIFVWDRKNFNNTNNNL